MGKKWLDIYDVDVDSNAPASQSKAAILFSLFEPSGFFTLQLNLSWRHSRSSLAWALFFQLRPLQAWLASGAHSKAVRSTSASEGTGRFQSVKIDRTALLLKLWSTISLCSTIYWQFHLWLEKENVKKAQCWENMKKGEAVASLARLSMKASANSDATVLTSLSEKTETWCSLIADSLVQNKPVVSSRHHNKELKRDPKTTRQTAATSEGKTELAISR